MTDDTPHEGVSRLPASGETTAAPPRDEDASPGRTTGTMAGRRTLLMAAAALAALAVTLLAVGLDQQEPAPPQATPAVRGEAPAAPPGQPTAGKEHEGHKGDGADPAPPRGTVLTKSAPERITVPALGVDSALESLGLDAKRVMETPDDHEKAGWFTPGPTPGELGPAVIAGHVTWNGARSVFFDLAKAAKGTRIEVSRKDGKTATFTVDRVGRYPKNQFPTLEVYRNLDHAGLRLITCGGTYDEATRHYSDNVIVYASLTSVR
ncbi:class F sortase [Streptomyces sp. NPDC088745]|uniref:class F sortase n=1 Tax=Streptomyces sp. NPDC088745 TaxID=3365884 RepID=UPI00381FF9B5